MTYEQIKQALEKYYGTIDNTGCYVRGDWLSLKKVLEIISKIEGAQQ